MKKLALSLAVALSITTSAAADSFTLGTGYGVEKINANLSVDLFQIQGLYRFDNGMTVGGMIMKGFPDMDGVASENRYEAIIGARHDEATFNIEACSQCLGFNLQGHVSFNVLLGIRRA